MEKELEIGRARCERAVAALPPAMSRELLRLAEGRRGGLAAVREVRVRRASPSEALIGSERIFFTSRPTAAELDETLRRITDGGLYAHRDTIREGYLSMDGGIRVGISGRARYDGGEVVGISEVSSLIFRIPGHGCDFSEQIEAAWQSGVTRGMLIYSPPGVGKTTALRHLAGYLGGECGLRVAVVDERCEFDISDYPGAGVDILSGYRKSVGVEIATRTLSPEVIMLDELGAEDTDGILAVTSCGVPVIATAHGGSLEELSTRPGIDRLISKGIFDLFVGIRSTPPTYSLEIARQGSAVADIIC